MMRRRSFLRTLVTIAATACGLQAPRSEVSPTPDVPPTLVPPTPTLGPLTTASPVPPSPARPPNPYGTVDATTLDRKLLFGYNGFCHTAGDGSALGDWWQDWSGDPTRIPGPETIAVDNWPDMSELDPDELFPTDLRYPDGRVVSVFSSFRQKTVVRHFRWMGQYGLDGVLVQRFPTSPWDPKEHAFRDAVQGHVREGCETYGRVFALEYDIGSMRRNPRNTQLLGPADLVEEIQDDWKYLVDITNVTESQCYLRHRGHPVLSIHGLGLPGRPGSVSQAQERIAWFTRDAPERYRVVLMGGVLTDWRTSPGPTKDPGWLDVVRSFDAIQPWNVGSGWPPGRSMRTDEEVQAFRRNVIDGDVAESRRLGKAYMPVIFPGISWSNRARFQSTLPDHQVPGPLDELNAVPRRAGAFWWRQLYECISAGCQMIKGAMFDEVDEGTAMFKLAATARDAPARPRFVTLDIDGLALPSDWYLRLAGAGTRMLRGEIPLTPDVPIKPS